MDIEKYRGVIPAFYACYDEAGQVSGERTRALARHLVNKGVKGLYVGGSSGECIYLEKEERMAILEGIARGEMAIAEGRVLSQEQAEKRLARWLK